MDDDFLVLDETGLRYLLNKDEKTASVRCDELKADTLEEAIIPATINLWDVDFTVNEIHIKGFARCEHLKKVIIPNTIDRLLRSTFEYCKRLENVEIPASVKIFMPNLFYRCINLKRIVFENLEESNSNTEGFNLNEDVFRGCNKDIVLEDKTTGKEYRLNDIIKSENHDRT